MEFAQVGWLWCLGLGTWVVVPLSGAIIGAAIEVHKYLGPGLLEGGYEACLEEVTS